MADDLPAWVAELTDPRRARTLDELADRLVPLAEHAIDVSRRLQTLLTELNEPFRREALYQRVERLKTRSAEALEDVSVQITSSGAERVESIWAALRERGVEGDLADVVRRRLEADVFPSLAERERAAEAQVTGCFAGALEVANQRLLTRVGELAAAVTELIHNVLPLAHDGLTLANRVSALATRVRQAGHGPITAGLRDESDELTADYDKTVARLELEWSALGARAAIVRAALRGAEETAFSEVISQMTGCFEKLAPGHIKMLNDFEAEAMALVEELTSSPSPPP